MQFVGHIFLLRISHFVHEIFGVSMLCLILCMLTDLVAQDASEPNDVTKEDGSRVLFLNMSEVIWPYTLSMFSACHQELSELTGKNSVMIMDSILPSHRALDTSAEDNGLVIPFDSESIDACVAWDPQGVATSFFGMVSDVPVFILQPYNKQSSVDLFNLSSNIYIRNLQFDATKMLGAIESCCSDVNRIIVISGAGLYDKMSEWQVRSQMGNKFSAFDIEYWSEKTVDELLEDVAALPSNCAIYYLIYSEDRDGNKYVPRDFIRQLSFVSSVPIFGIVDTYFDNGMVGGYVDTPILAGKQIAKDLASLISGDPVDRYRLLNDSGEYMFDWKMLKRWGIPVGSLPKNSVILNNPISFAAGHPKLIWLGVFFILLMIFLVIYLRFSHRMLEQKLEYELQSKQVDSRYKSFFENMPSGFVLLKNLYDEEGNVHDYEILRMNASMIQSTGLKFEDIKGRSVFEILTGVQSDWKEFFLQAASCAEPVYYEAYSPIFKRYYFATAFCPEKNHLALILLDISERKKALIELEDSKTFLRTVLDTLPIKIFWKDTNSAFMGMNKAVIDDSSTDTVENLIGKTGDDMPWTKEETEAYRAGDVEVMSTGVAQLNREEAQHQSDGKLHWLLTNKLPLMNRQGECIGVIGTAEDITERKSLADELKRLSTAMEQFPDTVVITDRDGFAEYVNPAFENITGYTKDEVLGRNMSVLASGTHDDEFYKELWSTIKADKIWKGHIINKRKDGTLYTERASIAPVTDSNGLIINFVAIKRDITQELIHEEKLNEVQKMEAVGQLAGGVAHDFNNTLQAILGFCDLLLLDSKHDSPQEHDLIEIQKATLHASTLTRQLLDFSRKTPSCVQDLDINQLIAHSEPIIRSVVGESIDIVFKLCPESCSVKGDEDQIKRVVLNLCINARDAMSSGDKLTLSTNSVSSDEERVQDVPQLTEGEFVCISVEDTGSGIPEDVKKHIFEPFFSTKGVGKGTGLGLASVYGIIHKHKGWIDVRSEVGKGSIFDIYIPMSIASDSLNK
jgi:PAS domain S-box-containing protein